MKSFIDLVENKSPGDIGVGTENIDMNNFIKYSIKEILNKIEYYKEFLDSDILNKQKQLKKLL